jgi:vacuolar-type H+-ATPase subunit H
MSDKKDEVLIAENEVKQRINQVLLEKDDLLRQAKEKAKKELKSHDDDMRVATQEKVTELLVDRTRMDEVDEQTRRDLILIEENFVKNKSQVVDFLFGSVINVNIVIPDVVIGCFEEKMLN